MQAYIRLGVGDDKVEFRNSSLHVRFAVLFTNRLCKSKSGNSIVGKGEVHLVRRRGGDGGL